ncbi:MAG: EcsC family protein [Flavisolibacter sp.]
MSYDQLARAELATWQKRMQRRPSVMNRMSKGMQTKINSYIPEKVHLTLTRIIKEMIRGVLFGSQHTTKQPRQYPDLMTRETTVMKLIDGYKKTAAAEGGVTGAGGFLLAMADFPILLGIKIKLLFDMASHYGFDVKDYRERLFILYIFQLAFSSQEHRRNVYSQIVDWDKRKLELPTDINQFDWRSFQQEYRDYIDLAKLAQLIPGIGAVVGLIVNYKLLKKLGDTAMNAYRMRIFAQESGNYAPPSHS